MASIWSCPHKSLITVILPVLANMLICGSPAAGEFRQLHGVIHVHSTFSSGRYSIEELVSKAKTSGLEVLILTDHDLVAMEYGLFPFRNLIKKRVERRSVLRAGPEHYLAAIDRLNKKQQSVLIIPGVQSSPFYYWGGSPLGGGLTAYDFRKELILVGLSAPEDYYGLPLLHGAFSTRYIKELSPEFAVFFAVFLLSLYLIFTKGRMRICGAVIAMVSFALMIDHHPFKSSRFDPYHGDQGIAPFQEVIDYTRSRGGLVFWAHPESNYSKDDVQLGPIRMMTKHYPDDLIAAANYTGFAALYGDNITVTRPGMQWDRILTEYCRGLRSKPAWGIAESDFHVENKDEALDSFQTVFLAEEKSAQSVLEALARGRIYAVAKAGNLRLSLDQFQIKDHSTGRPAIMGAELVLTGGLPFVEGRISASDGGRYNVAVSIVRGGKLIWSFAGQTPVEFHFEDQDQWVGKTFYRLDAHAAGSAQLLSNPIFVSRK